MLIQKRSGLPYFQHLISESALRFFDLDQMKSQMLLKLIWELPFLG